MVRVRVLVPLPLCGLRWLGWKGGGVCLGWRTRVVGKLWGRITEFLSEVKAELKKVTYPTRDETIGSTSVVVVFCVIMSLYLSFVDSILVWLVSRIL